MAGITEINNQQKAGFIIDYSGMREDDMIELVHALKLRIMQKNVPVVILSLFNDRSYATPRFMRAVERETQEALHLIDKQATVGLNEIKQMILKGYNFVFNRNIQNFKTMEDALQFLWDDTTSDRLENNE